MLCRKPFMKGTVSFGCGQCLPCRINRRRLWTHRMILESLLHGDCSFVTLTYNDESLPKGGTLVPGDARDWLKRLRAKVAPRKVRYYLVGEYGDESQRPHYHAALFGLGLADADVIQETWALGHTYTGDLTLHSASYIAGYVTKKMTKKDDPRLAGRYPEFARMSLKPGIAGDFVDRLVDPLTSGFGVDEILVSGDVPSFLAHGKKKLPLGRYLKRRLREKLGYKESMQKEAFEKYKMQLREVWLDRLKDPKNKSKTFKEIILEENKQKIMNVEGRHKIFSKKGNI